MSEARALNWERILNQVSCHWARVAGSGPSYIHFLLLSVPHGEHINSHSLSLTPHLTSFCRWIKCQMCRWASPHWSMWLSKQSPLREGGGNETARCRWTEYNLSMNLQKLAVAPRSAEGKVIRQKSRISHRHGSSMGAHSDPRWCWDATSVEVDP